MRPVVDGLKPEYAGKVDFQEIDFYEQRDLATKYGVPGHPTLVFLDSAGNRVQVLPGVPPRERIVDALEQAAGN